MFEQLYVEAKRQAAQPEPVTWRLDTPLPDELTDEPFWAQGSHDRTPGHPPKRRSRSHSNHKSHY